MNVNLCDFVVPSYNQIRSWQQGGIRRPLLVFRHHQCTQVVPQDFKSKRFTQLQGENISIMTKDFMLPRLVWMKLVPCQMKLIEIKFVGLLSVVMHTLRQSLSKEKWSFSFCFPIVTSSYGSSPFEPTNAKSKYILQDANDLYINFATSNKWVLILDNHGLNHCKDPCDKDCIAQNNAKFEEE